MSVNMSLHVSYLVRYGLPRKEENHFREDAIPRNTAPYNLTHPKHERREN